MDWCVAYADIVQKAQKERIKQGLKPTWKIFIVDWIDFSHHKRCHNIEELVGSDNVQYSKRSIVTNRVWNETWGWVEVGNRIDFNSTENKIYEHIPLTVRTDTVEGLDYVLKKVDLKLTDPIERLPRSYDVISLWPKRDSPHINQVQSHHYGQLRFEVSELVDRIAQQHFLKSHVGLSGSAAQTGRWGLQMEYLELLLNTKITVVMNRDGWEDHYRLMETLITGTLVFTDKMMALPKGLEHGKSIIEVESPQDLEAKILYYLDHDNTEERLAIAAEGRHIAMSQHRTWHRMEQIVFGQIQTTCDEDDPNDPCPYTVHAYNHALTACNERKHGPSGSILNCSSWHMKRRHLLRH